LKKKDIFDVQNVELESSNLIEASAGTGKTFSIAILVLRLIIDKDLDIKQILMVTFTKAAVAELESRIREFIREAYRYIQNPELNIDKQIIEIVDNGVKKTNQKIILDRLKGASLNLDETAIFTIHSFCQKTLTEFAFETHQLFGSELLDNQSQIIEKATNEYWRKEITTLSVEKIKLLRSIGLSKDNLTSVIHKGLSEKKFIYKENLQVDKYFESTLKKDKLVQKSLEEFISLFKLSEENNLSYLQNQKGSSNAIKTFGKSLNNAELFLKILLDKYPNTKYIEKLFPKLLKCALAYQERLEDLNNSLRHLLFFYYGQAINIVKKHVDKTKQRLSVMVFDDLITNLHLAVTGVQEDLLKAELQKKYKAVFIDEFQDTDRKQYEIFDKLFGKSSILFYIGDPKQAIYSFRGADIDTYKEAANSTSNAFTMDRNYRSTAKLIEGMNSFFRLIENPFADTNIQYEDVKNGQGIAELELDGIEQKPIAYLSCSNKKEIAEQVSYHILNLLQNNYKVENRRIIPSDIGVLVRSKKEGIQIKNALNKLRIPSVTIDDAKVMESSEAQNIFYILKAVLEPNRANINRALLNSITSISKNYLLQESLEKDLINFKKIEKEWQKNSVLGAISLFIRLYHVKSHLLSNETENGERILTNIFQIMELLLRKELENKLLPKELLNHLHNIIEGQEVIDDEYSQRIESDEDAVKIVTIHKSKGLSYNLVFAPFLDLQSKPDAKYTFLEYKNNKLEACFSLYKTEEEIEIYREQTEQENRRLIYVSLTRAVYKNFIFHNTYHNGGKGSIMHFVNKMNPTLHFEPLNELEFPQKKYQITKIKERKPARVFLRNIKRDWGILSYSQLSDKHISFSLEKKESWDNNYDKFVFDQLPKGAFAGNFLHDLFEHSSFSEDNFMDLVKDISQKYSTIFDENLIDKYQELILNVLNSKYTDSGFKLSEINNSKKLPELEFYFNLTNFSPDKILKISQLIDIESSRITQGMMYGFIDLFFEHQGKYYILDWKSNFLGNRIEDYSTDNIELAMRGNNYHLQYLIYTVAVKRFLSLKIPDFNYKKQFGGVLYVFLRGCRENKNTGIFYSKPDEGLIDRLDKLL